ncbi:MAG: proton-conducting transporter membrane subunit, partial [Candidatus Omnitrophica bacterium]|nr:proton-conducting transporter membrane subunit [Candidatus Omnitrophota bacterium]
GGLAFVLLVIGAISKAGSMPFHSWIPDAAIDAPTPFMAIIPASLDKLLGIYFLTRVTFDMFRMEKNSWASYLLMIGGAATIILAVMMALIQKNYKRLLAYHAISQVGYMVLGIGTALPVGIMGALFHMINNALYKSCLFLTGGSVERQAGTSDLGKLGGIGPRMPVTFACFLITAAAISGVPPFNGFFSKELLYGGALERGVIFYLAAIMGTFLTAASFLKLGHSVFFGKINKENEDIKESPLAMTIPMVVIALVCIFFGIFSFIPVNKLILPVLGSRALEAHPYTGFPDNMMLVAITIVVLICAFLNHLYGVKRTGSALKSLDHIRYAPGLSPIYDRAEKGYFDPYDIVLKVVNLVAGISWRLDRLIDWFYSYFSVKAAYVVSSGIRRLHDGNHKVYVIWSIAGAVAVIIFLFKG